MENVLWWGVVSLVNTSSLVIHRYIVAMQRGTGSCRLAYLQRLFPITPVSRLERRASMDYNWNRTGSFYHSLIHTPLPVWGDPEDVPPTIVFGLPAGSAAIEPTGTLAVFPGSILHLECLFARRLGNPEWTWTSTFRQYLTGERDICM